MVEEFPDNQMIKQVMDGKTSMPSDPAKRAVFQVQIARLQEKKEKKERKRSSKRPQPATAAAPEPAPPSATETAKTAEELAAALLPAQTCRRCPTDGTRQRMNAMSIRERRRRQ